jgi:uncharacterized membrane protein (UPF0182 family)
VIRGNLLAIPVGETFIYVEPVYLEAIQEERQSAPATGTSQTSSRAKPQQEGARAASLPELKRVIAAFGNRLVMEENLENALSSILDIEIAKKQRDSQVTPQIKGESLSNLGVIALDHYNKAKVYLRSGDWTGYGRELESLEKILKKLSEMENIKKE